MRVLSKECPFAGALAVVPDLEDAYLYATENREVL